MRSLDIAQDRAAFAAQPKGFASHRIKLYRGTELESRVL